MRKKLQPVSLDGIEFDALLDEQKTLTATVPSYPVESGFSVSDTIILDPFGLKMTLYVSNTPVTWLHRHGTSTDRVRKICEQIENLWASKKLVKIVTNDAIYRNMAITSIGIKKSKELGYAREIAIQAQKIFYTSTKLVTIPDYLLKSGETGANAGTAATSNTDSGNNGTTGGTTEETPAKKSQSILYGVADGMNFY